MQITSGMKWLVLLGTVTVLGGFVSGEKLYRNTLVHGLIDVIDIKDESCQDATVSSGSSCPMGCRAKPALGPELSGRAPECRSVLWVATCGAECDARKGLIRMPEGQFLESTTLLVQLDEPAKGFKDEFNLIGVELQSGVSGLWRYRAHFDNPEDDIRVLEKIESRIRALSYADSVTRILK